ncbi:glutamate ligase domain-containing protein, partial [Cellulomonas bogoriensis]|uniref:glutamate ligase domain-containing protein n=1 Tax=Cellulomonas bogoriensis TaxID=301388 RepID=UPI000555CAC1
SRSLAARVRASGRQVVTYGTVDDADVRLVGWAPSAGGEASGRATLVGGPGSPVAVGEHVDLRLGVPGAHNALNATAAWTVGVLLGAGPVAAAAALERFAGTGRRFEDRGTAAGVRVVDDYAHHPTEVAALLRAARPVSGGRVLVLFQPHLYSRTRTFAGEFAEALALADHVVVTDVYAAREDHDPSVTGGTITDLMDARGRFVPDRFEAARAVAALAAPGDLVLTVGAGDVTELAPVILEELSG